MVFLSSSQSIKFQIVQLNSEADVSFKSRQAFVAFLLFLASLAFNIWGTSVGWKSGQLPGNEFRQTQTAITALFIQHEHNFSLAYPTPVLGKPWSVPFEFPLYQWTVVLVSDATGLPLTQAGRGVSWACFYLALPAIWLLLSRMGVGIPGRWVVLGVVLTCPLYIFYARAFLIETMALMFGLWFLLAFILAVERRSLGWLALANAAGIGVGLVKVTTFIVYLIPAGIWALTWLWSARRSASRPDGGWRQIAQVGGWIVAGVAIPVGATGWWIRFADHIKEQSPTGREFLSWKLHAYNFGTWSSRLDPEIWAAHWRIQVTNIAPWFVLVGVAVFAVTFSRRWLGWIAGCVLLYFLIQALFPILYAWHEYYFVSSAVLLLAAMGLALCGALESKLPHPLVWAGVLGLYVAQGVCYHGYLYKVQKTSLPGGNGVTDLLREISDPEDVVIIAGDDWSSVTPYYARRRAFMIRRNLDRSWDYLRQAFSALRGESVSVLLMRGASRENPELRQLVNDFFGIETEPVAGWDDYLIYVSPKLRPKFEDRLRFFPYRGVVLARKFSAENVSDRLTAVSLTMLTVEQRKVFDMMSPMPDRFFSTFGLDVVDLDGRRVLNAHPDFKLWFAVSPGLHRVSASYGIFQGAYTNVPVAGATDGVEFSVHRIGKNGEEAIVFRRLLNPRDHRSDRGLQNLEFSLEVQAGDELFFETGPGPQGVANRDWAYWATIKID